MQSQAITLNRRQHRTQAWSRMVRAILATRGISQNALSDAIGICASQVRSAISQGSYPGTIRAIEKELGIKPSAKHLTKAATKNRNQNAA